MTHLMPWNPREVPTLWARLHPAGASLDGILDIARMGEYARVMLTGAPLPAGFLLGDAPGWTHGAHHLDHATPTGRYTHAATGHRVELRRAAEWFGEGDYTPETARGAWQQLGADVARTFGRGAGLLGSPGATGRELWLRSCPRDKDTGRTITPAQPSAEVAELIRATSGQHRIELRRPAAETMPALHVMDGRLMYAACVRELGTGGTMITGDEARELMDSPRGAYARARYQVRATIPAWWDTLGILPLAGEDGDGWSYPDAPGATFTTWADAAEVHLARAQFGWKVEPLAGILFDKGRPLDTWADRLLRLHTGTTSRLVRAAVRSMLLYSIGAWHSSGRTETTVTAGAMDRPAGDGWSAPTTSAHGAVWRRQVPLDGRAALMAHPEWSAQVWGRARARVLWAPTGDAGTPAGALTLDPDQLVSIYGDAVMTTADPGWPDDGKPGRLRTKGHLCGPIPWPTTAAARDHVMHQAERATAAGTVCTCTGENTP